jgi:vacuolar-type H+-ATPase subunit E/Vma4
MEGVRVIDTDAVDIVYSELDEKLMSDNFMQAVQKACHDTFNRDVSLRFIKSDFKDIGVIVQSGDARLMYDTRFSARLKRLHDDIYMALLKESA